MLGSYVDKIGFGGITLLPEHSVGWRIGKAFQLADGLGQHFRVVILIDYPAAPAILF